MIKQPTTRAQAVGNAIHAAETAHQCIQSASRSTPWSALAHAWAEIAKSMPEDKPETLMERFLSGLTHEEAKMIQLHRQEGWGVVPPEFISEAKLAIAFKNRADKNETLSVSPEEREIIDGLRAGTHAVVEMEEKDFDVYEPGDKIITRDQNGNKLEFHVMRNGDLLLETGTRDIDRPMVEVTPSKGLRMVDKREYFVRGTSSVASDALDTLRAFCAARVMHSEEAVTMQRTDFDRYKTAVLKVTVTRHGVAVSTP